MTGKSNSDNKGRRPAGTTAGVSRRTAIKGADSSRLGSVCGLGWQCPNLNRLPWLRGPPEVDVGNHGSLLSKDDRLRFHKFRRACQEARK